jgi:hypothetical protein
VIRKEASIEGDNDVVIYFLRDFYSHKRKHPYEYNEHVNQNGEKTEESFNDVVL